jgi:hypothetical protein
MQFYGQSEQAANRILDTFKSGKLPAALAPLFIRRTDGVPCRRWSWSNQLLTALAGTSDARGFRQWHDDGPSRLGDARGRAGVVRRTSRLDEVEAKRRELSESRA